MCGRRKGDQCSSRFVESVGSTPVQAKYVSLFKLNFVYVSKSDILVPIAYLSDIEILVSFEKAMFE